VTQPTPDNPDVTDIVWAMQKVDAFHDPAEANALLTAAAEEIKRLRARVAMGPYWHPGDEA
jgi:hypothetical protein